MHGNISRAGNNEQRGATRTHSPWMLIAVSLPRNFLQFEWIPTVTSPTKNFVQFHGENEFAVRIILLITLREHVF